MASAILSSFVNGTESTGRDGASFVDTALKNPSLTAIGAIAVTSLFVLLSQVGALDFARRSKDAAPRLPGLSWLQAYKFFVRRYDFARDGFKRVAGQKNFTFNVIQHKVVEMSGISSRHFFFTDNKLNFTDGYRLLMGGSPNAEGDEVVSIQMFAKRLLLLLRRERLVDFIPALMGDIDEAIKPLGPSGQFDPFKEIYDVVFRMTVRMATCAELADSPDDIKRMHQLYFTIEKAATPLRMMFPSLPWPAKKRGTDASTELYNMLKSYIEKRKAAGADGSDSIDLLISQGDTDDEIINFVMGTIFAGVINTGMNSSWVLLFLSQHPEWSRKATDEINSLLTTHSTLPASAPLYQRLGSIPVSAYEDDMPVLESIIREDLRIIMASNTLLRRNNAPNDIVVPGRAGEPDFTIEKGTFMAYNLSDVHFDPIVYPNPQAFDPSRYGPGQEQDKKTEHAFLGWGVGRHPCLGMKVAKLEMKMILAYMLSAYDLELVDKNGKPATVFPEPDRNDLQMARPTTPTWLKYVKKDDVVL